MLTAEVEAAPPSRAPTAWTQLRRVLRRVPFGLLLLTAVLLMVGADLSGMHLGRKHVHQVTYRVDGKGTANIVYTIPLGDGPLHKMVRQVPLPWTSTQVFSGAVTDYGLVAKANSRSARTTITCAISVDGQQAWTARERAALAKVHCEATPYQGR